MRKSASMSLWRQLTRGLRVLFHRSAADRELEDEVAHYLDEAAATLEAGGLSPGEARRAARRQYGNVTVARDEVRASGWERMAEAFAADVRYGARRLRRTPGFTVVAALTLALGIGASTAIFSAVNPILFESLPYPGADRLVAIWDHNVEGTNLDVTFGTYRELVERSRTFEALAVTKPWQPTLTGPAEPERLNGQRVSASYFDVWAVPPVIGRGFDAADDRPNGAAVAIIGHGLWQRRFSGDRAILGRQITLDDVGYTVVGVMPESFENVMAPAAEIWTLLQYDATLPPQGREWGHHLRLVGRLRTGIRLDEVRAELDAIAQAPAPGFRRPTWSALRHGLLVSSMQEDVTRSVRSAAVAVLGAVLFVLGIACVNVTNLLLARGAQRRDELAMRAALGASRGRLMAQALTESLLLAGAGGALGLLLARAGIGALLAIAPPGLPRARAIDLDGHVFAFALAATTVIGVLVGLLPALHASRHDLHPPLQHRTRSVAGSHHTTRRALVVAEVALALVLLVGAGLQLRSLERLFAISPGFDPAGLVTLQVQTSGRRFPDDATTNRFFERALDTVREVPDVAAAFTSQLPLSGDVDEYGVQLAAGDGAPQEPLGSVFRYAVTPGYFEVMRIPLRSGRLLDARDVANAAPVAVISESLANARFPGRNAIGQRAHVGPTDRPPFTIVGIVGNVRQVSLASNNMDAVYVTTAQWHTADSVRSLVVRAPHDLAALAPGIRKAIWSVDKDQPIVRVATMEALVDGLAAERRFALRLFELFALAALTLAAIGIYGVLASSVTERTRELGVRTALGASRGDVFTLILGQGLRLAGVGVAIGLLAALLASHALTTLLFAVSQFDPATYAGVVALLLCVSVLACVVPGWRAVRVDPAITLRAE